MPEKPKQKTIFTFTVFKETEVDETEITKDESGAEVKTTKKVKKQTPFTFQIRRPNRSLRESAALYYGAKLSENIRAGLMPFALLEKRIAGDGGAFADEEKQKYAESWKKLLEVQDKYQRIALKKDEELTDEDKKDKEILPGQFVDIQDELSRFETLKTAMYEHTAEAQARNSLAVWWVMFLSQKLDGEVVKDFFEGKTEKEKLDNYDKIAESDDSFLLDVTNKFFSGVSLWMTNAEATQEDFDKLNNLFDKKNV